MYVLYEFDGVEIPELHKRDYKIVGAPKVRDYLTPVVGGNFIDRYQNGDGSYDDVLLGRRTLTVETIAIRENSERMFTRWNNLRLKQGTYGKLYRRWATVNAYTSGPRAIYGRQWIWARMIERPLQKYGNWGRESSLNSGNAVGAAPHPDHSLGHQPMSFVFETVDPYWKYETAETEFESLTSGVLATFTLTVGEVPITDAVLTISGAATSVAFAIDGYTAWTITRSGSDDTIVNSGTDEVTENGTNVYDDLTYDTTLNSSTQQHLRAPLIHIPAGTHTCYALATGGAASLSFSYYLSFKE